jgi:2-haloacid dehalogenase
MAESLPEVQALLFDVFGTVVDWHGSVTRELEALGRKHGIGAPGCFARWKLRWQWDERRGRLGRFRLDVEERLSWDYVRP